MIQIWGHFQWARLSPAHTLQHSLVHGLLLVHVHAVPPFGQEGDLCPDELPPGVFRQLHQHVVEDVLSLVCVVLIKCLDPA